MTEKILEIRFLFKFFIKDSDIPNMKKYFSVLFVCIFVFLLGCGKVRNSSSQDAAIYGASVSGSATFLQARTVMASQCFSCHSNWSSFSENQFLTSSLVRAGNLSGSSLYTRIRGNDTGQTGDMPQSNPNLSSDDLNSIKQWIQGI